MTKKLLFIVASDGFQPMEYFQPKKILETAGVQIVTGSNKAGEVFASHTNEKIQAEFALENVNVDDFDGIFFIGGSGAMEYLNNEKSYQLLQSFAQAGKALWFYLYFNTYFGSCWSAQRQKGYWLE